MAAVSAPVANRVLVVDDEDNITFLLDATLRHFRFETCVVKDGRAALAAAADFAPHLILLDVMLPDLDGFEVVRRLRLDGSQVPVLFLTAGDTTEDKVRGLTLGGDDYVTKPFSVEEVVARVQAILRRNGTSSSSSTLALADLEMDDDAHLVRRAGQVIDLSPTEYNLLRFLLVNAGRALSRAQILDHVWRYDFGGEAMRRMAEEGKRMGALVEDLLVLARLDQQRASLHAPVRLDLLVADGVRDARAVEPDRPITLESAVVTVPGDERQLRQIVANLLANARTHTPAGTPVEVCLEQVEGAVRLTVADHGPGLPPGAEEKVFERFYRVDGARTRSAGGNGLGLSIVATVAHAHGGRAWATSTPVTGAQFTVELPASPSDGRAPLPPLPESSGSRSSAAIAEDPHRTHRISPGSTSNLAA